MERLSICNNGLKILSYEKTKDNYYQGAQGCTKTLFTRTEEKVLVVMGVLAERRADTRIEAVYGQQASYKDRRTCKGRTEKSTSYIDNSLDYVTDRKV